MNLYQEIRRGNNTLTESHLRQQLLHEHSKELESVVRQREKADAELQRAHEENEALYREIEEREKYVALIEQENQELREVVA